MTSIAKLAATALCICLGTAVVAAPSKSTAANREAAKRHASSKAALTRIAAHARVRQPLVVAGAARHGGLRRVSLVRVEPTHPSFGQMIGLHDSVDSLELKSGVALVLDQDTNEVLFSNQGLSHRLLPAHCRHGGHDRHRHRHQAG